MIMMERRGEERLGVVRVSPGVRAALPADTGLDVAGCLTAPHIA